MKHFRAIHKTENKVLEFDLEEIEASHDVLIIGRGGNKINLGCCDSYILSNDYDIEYSHKGRWYPYNKKEREYLRMPEKILLMEKIYAYGIEPNMTRYWQGGQDQQLFMFLDEQRLFQEIPDQENSKPWYPSEQLLDLLLTFPTSFSRDEKKIFRELKKKRLQGAKDSHECLLLIVLEELIKKHGME